MAFSVNGRACLLLTKARSEEAAICGAEVRLAGAQVAAARRGWWLQPGVPLHGSEADTPRPLVRHADAATLGGGHGADAGGARVGQPVVRQECVAGRGGELQPRG